MKNRVNKKRKPVHIILDIIIGVLCVCMVGAVIFTVNMLNEDLNFSYDEESFYYRLSDEDYGQMVEMYHMNNAAGVKDGATLEQYYGIAKYFEAASFYKAYSEAGDTEQADKYLAQMQEAEKQMGRLAFEKGKICERLGIE